MLCVVQNVRRDVLATKINVLYKTLHYVKQITTLLDFYTILKRLFAMNGNKIGAKLHIRIPHFFEISIINIMERILESKRTNEHHRMMYAI